VEWQLGDGGQMNWWKSPERFTLKADMVLLGWLVGPKKAGGGTGRGGAGRGGQCEAPLTNYQTSKRRFFPAATCAAAGVGGMGDPRRPQGARGVDES